MRGMGSKSYHPGTELFYKYFLAIFDVDTRNGVNDFAPKQVVHIISGVLLCNYNGFNAGAKILG